MDAAVAPVGGSAGPDAGRARRRRGGMGRVGVGAAVARVRRPRVVVGAVAALGGFGERPRAAVGRRDGGPPRFVVGRRRHGAAGGGAGLRVRGVGRGDDAPCRVRLRRGRRAALPPGDALRVRAGPRRRSRGRTQGRRRRPRARCPHRPAVEGSSAPAATVRAAMRHSERIGRGWPRDRERPPFGPGTQPATVSPVGGLRSRSWAAMAPSATTGARPDASASPRIRLRYAYGKTASPWNLETYAPATH